jgi:hypothetical protein
VKADLTLSRRQRGRPFGTAFSFSPNWAMLAA